MKLHTNIVSFLLASFADVNVDAVLPQRIRNRVARKRTLGGQVGDVENRGSKLEGPSFSAERLVEGAVTIDVASLVDAVTIEITSPEDYEYEWWGDLLPEIQAAYATLGWDETSWNLGINPPSEYMNWDELTPEMQEAASVIGYTPEMWDGEEVGTYGIDDYAWCGLPSYMEEAAIVLGWNEYLWDNDGVAWSDSVLWEDLSVEAQDAAKVLGYDEVTWNTGVEDLLAKSAIHETTVVPKATVVIEEEINAPAIATDETIAEVALAFDLSASMSLWHMPIGDADHGFETELQNLTMTNHTASIAMEADDMVQMVIAPEMSLSTPQSELSLAAVDDEYEDYNLDVTMSAPHDEISIPVSEMSTTEISVHQEDNYNESEEDITAQTDTTQAQVPETSMSLPESVYGSMFTSLPEENLSMSMPEESLSMSMPKEETLSMSILQESMSIAVAADEIDDEQVDDTTDVVDDDIISRSDESAPEVDVSDNSGSR